MRRVAIVLLLAVGCVTLACGKYGPPVRAEQREQPAPAEEKSEEATP